MNAPASNRGFTLLELALAVALSAVLLTAFFSTVHALLQGLLMAADGVRGTAEAADAMDLMASDLERATSFTARNPYNVAFQTPDGPIAYRLFANDSASRDVVLERSFNGASASIGPRRMIANFNPDGASYYVGNTPTSDPYPMFIYAALGPGEAPKVDIYLILQANQNAPMRAFKIKTACITMTAW